MPPTREELVKFSAAKGGGAVGKDKKGRKGSSDSSSKLKDKGGRTVGSGQVASTCLASTSFLPTNLGGARESEREEEEGGLM